MLFIFCCVKECACSFLIVSYLFFLFSSPLFFPFHSDPVICWVISIQWELIEILFMHMLPNFAECWWDQWILDVALANGLGIYFGCKLAKYLEVKEYNWGPYNSIPSFVGKAKRTIMQFTPASWTRVQWKSTSSITRLFGSVEMFSRGNDCWGTLNTHLCCPVLIIISFSPCALCRSMCLL
jgi:hypothetical protein